mmetsp:Transcript_127833/g.239005  ORF Transcript_127833/g.239005 Transcript_127833/m.239005 type:complete len:365 (-) Transcript_127833:128-1222(-)
MQREQRCASQEVEITSEALASLFGATASAPSDLQGLLFGRVRKPAAKNRCCDGDASSSAVAKERPCVVLEAYLPLGRPFCKGVFEYLPEAQGRTRPVFTEQVKEKIKPFTTGGQHLLGWFGIESECPSRFQLVLKNQPRISTADLDYIYSVGVEVRDTFKEEGIRAVVCKFGRESEVGDIGTYVTKVESYFVAGGWPRLNMKVGSIGQTVEAEPAVPRLPPENAELREIFHQQEEMRRDMIKRLEGSVQEGLKRLNHEQLDVLGARLHEEARSSVEGARLSDNAEAPEHAVHDMEAPLATESEALASNAPELEPELEPMERLPAASNERGGQNDARLLLASLKGKKRQQADMEKGGGPPAKMRK